METARKTIKTEPDEKEDLSAIMTDDGTRNKYLQKKLDTRALLRDCEKEAATVADSPICAIILDVFHYCFNNFRKIRQIIQEAEVVDKVHEKLIFKNGLIFSIVKNTEQYNGPVFAKSGNAKHYVIDYHGHVLFCAKQKTGAPTCPADHNCEILMYKPKFEKGLLLRKLGEIRMKILETENREIEARINELKENFELE
jgi:hypothetical protein